ncbi:MAG: DUF2807 domain-containing protein [Bacteroidota bacterium]
MSRLLTVAALAFVLASVCSAQDARIARTFDLPAFNALSVGHGVTFELEPGSTQRVSVEARTSDFDLIEAVVEGSVLVVRPLDWRNSPGGVVVRVTAPMWSRIDGGGGARVTAHFDQTEPLALDLGGGAVITASGSLNELTVEAGGGARIDAEALMASEVRLNAAGGGRIRLPSSLYFQPDASSGDTRVYTTAANDVELPDPYIARERTIRTVGSGEAAMQRRTVEAFDEVFIGERLSATIVVGPQRSVSVMADDNLVEYVETQVRDGRLYVFAREPLRTRSGLSATITVPSLTRLETGPDAQVAVTDIAAGTFVLREGPRAIVTLDGTATRLDADLDIDAQLEARDLLAESVVIDGQSQIKAAVSPSESVRARLYFNTDVCYTGNPSTVRKSGPGGDYAKLRPCD